MAMRKVQRKVDLTADLMVVMKVVKKDLIQVKKMVD